MEKEMKKLLLVAVSVGVFLLVTITVAIFISTAKVQENTISSSVPYSNRGTSSPAFTNIPPLPEPAPAIISTADPIVEISNEAAISENHDIKDRNGVTIHVIPPTTAAVPDSPVAAAIPPKEAVIASVKPAEKQAEKQAANVSGAASKPASAAKQPAAASKPAATAAAAKPSSSSKPVSSRLINDYWVQTGAFSSMVRAEDAKEVLYDKGLTSIIETSIINGQNFFRVRLGPYTSENEAKHWLAIVQLIDGFHDSQVRQTVR